MHPQILARRRTIARIIQCALLLFLLPLVFGGCSIEDVAIRECNDGDIDLFLCEDEDRYVERRCDNERWTPQTVDCSTNTLLRYACEDGLVETVLCDDGRSVRERQCTKGEWNYGTCEALSACAEDDSLTVVCPNEKEQQHHCVEQQWSPPIECTSQCLDDGIKENSCGLNLRGDQTRTCVEEQWADDWVCHDPDECTDGELDTIPCQGWTGRTPTTCIEGQWVASTCENITLTGTSTDTELAAFGFCGLNADGAALCWGSNREGQVGAGHQKTVQKVLPVTGAHRFTSIARGAHHGCGVNHVGDLYCWGGNAYGQLGIEGVTTQLTPQKVPSLEGIAYLAAGPRNTCVINSEAHLYCWGSNEHGQLADEEETQSAVPLRIAGLENVQRVAISHGTICATAEDKTLYCWGDNRASQVSHLPKDVEPTPTAIYNMLLVTHVAVASDHVCAIRSGDVYCWGDNSFGQIGDNSSYPASLPVKVSLPHKAHDIDVGRRLSCAVTLEGELYCWGANAWNEIVADDDTNSYPTPQLIASVNNVASVAISSGSNDFLGHTVCAATRAGDVACWGRVYEDSIPGDALNTHTDEPVFVSPD